MLKSEIVRVNEPRMVRSFPLIAKIRELNDIVLFNNERSGVVLFVDQEKGDSHWLGEYSNSWISCFDERVWEILDSVTIKFKAGL